MERVPLILAFAYLLGSLPFAWLVGKLLRGIDIRQHGSGNAGATNVFRVMGPGPGCVVAALDVGKGWMAVWVANALSDSPGSAIRLAAALAAMAGHSWPIWLGFRGGKGVLTAAGAFLNLAWLPLACSLAIFGVVFGISRYVSLGSLIGAAALPVMIAVIPGEWRNPAVFGAGLVVAILITITHIPNIKRLVRGEEHGFSWRKRRERRGKRGRS